MTNRYTLKVSQGSTFATTLRWESYEKAYISISQVAKTAPVSITTTEPHNLPDAWRVKVTGVLGTKEINSENYVLANVVDPTTVSINSINATQYTTYSSGGVLEYNKPIDLANYSAKLQIRKNLTSEVALEVSSDGGDIVLDNTLKTITLTLPDSKTSLLDFRSGVYSLELYNSSSNHTTTLLEGVVTITPEITR